MEIFGNRRDTDMKIGRSTVQAGLAASVIALLMAGQASADWRIYVSGDLGFSVATGDVSGQVDIAGLKDIGGDDTSVSPLLGTERHGVLVSIGF